MSKLQRPLCELARVPPGLRGRNPREPIGTRWRSGSALLCVYPGYLYLFARHSLFGFHSRGRQHEPLEARHLWAEHLDHCIDPGRARRGAPRGEREQLQRCEFRGERGRQDQRHSRPAGVNRCLPAQRRRHGLFPSRNISFRQFAPEEWCCTLSGSWSSSQGQQRGGGL